jgi:hypothetical protein
MVMVISTSALMPGMAVGYINDKGDFVQDVVLNELLPPLTRRQNCRHFKTVSGKTVCYLPGKVTVTWKNLS